jgi:hypothetical protein
MAFSRSTRYLAPVFSRVLLFERGVVHSKKSSYTPPKNPKNPEKSKKSEKYQKIPNIHKNPPQKTKNPKIIKKSKKSNNFLEECNEQFSV